MEGDKDKEQTKKYKVQVDKDEVQNDKDKVLGCVKGAILEAHKYLPVDYINIRSTVIAAFLTEHLRRGIESREFTDEDIDRLNEWIQAFKDNKVSIARSPKDNVKDPK